MIMKNVKMVLVYGFLLWLVPFLVSFLIFSIHQNNRALFETIMVVMGVGLTVWFSKRLDKVNLITGLTWMLMSLVLDSFVFIWGPLKMDIWSYFADIGLTYLVFPIITLGMTKNEIIKI
jgi:hypothetical protein